MGIDTTGQRTRRAFLGAGLSALAATVAGAFGRSPVTNAADGGPVILAGGNTATGTTQITATNTAFVGTSSSGIGLEGFSDTNTGVAGFSDTNTGVYGQSVSGTALHAFSGPNGTGQPAPPGVAVFGESAGGRGGVFRGTKAQIQLRASSATTRPTRGAKGDLFVDASGRLWFCKGGTNWVKLA